MTRPVYQKGQKITYRSGSGILFSARVDRVHKNGEITVTLLWYLRDGRESGCFCGDRFRIGERNIAHMERSPEPWQP